MSNLTLQKLFLQTVGVQIFLLTILSPPLIAAEATDDAQASFNYISSTLQTFRESGRLVNNPGIDGSDLEHFIALLEDAYEGFSKDFNSDSAMCSFYRDPENGRMTIEERAELSFLYLRSIDARIELFDRANREFEEAVIDQFGRIVLENISSIKQDSLSNQRLPSSSFDEAATISFLDAMCT